MTHRNMIHRATSQPSAPGHLINVLSLNMRKGLGDHVRWKGMDHLERAIAMAQPDLVLLQEVFHPFREKGWGQGERLAAHLSMELAYTPNNALPTGHYGNATLSRFPIVCYYNYNISTNPIEKRGALYTRVAVHGQPLHLINAHLGLNNRQRRVQVGLIEKVMNSHVEPGKPLLVGGDFNDWSGQLRKRISRQWPLEDALGHLPYRARRTWHTRLPLFNLDHLYYTALSPLSVRVDHSAQWRGLSDHFPVVARFLLPLEPRPA